MAVESLLLTAKVGHSSEDFVRRGAFSGVSKFLCDKIFAGDPQVSCWSCSSQATDSTTIACPGVVSNLCSRTAPSDGGAGLYGSINFSSNAPISKEDHRSDHSNTGSHLSPHAHGSQHAV
eukprot:scaffold56057_cov30-Cyclotella_meneghiniana.AAC.1